MIGRVVAPHSECAETIRSYMAARGVEVNVSEKRPGMVMPAGFDELALSCPHGVPMWAEPTSEQRLQWIADGVW